MQRVLIFAGGELGEWALDEITEGDFLIGADRGAYFLVQHGINPHLSLGDFDSVSPDELALIRRRSKQFQPCDPIDKDYTDTELACTQALELMPREIVILGGLGSRFDHSLANVHLLCKMLRQGVRGKIIHPHNEIILIDRSAIIHKKRYTHVSLLPLSDEVTGITLEGFVYPLDHATLRIGHSIGVSNVLLRETGRIHVGSGLLLVIQSKD